MAAMTEQDKREAYFNLTGRIATSDISGYWAFCKGMEYEREACAKLCDVMHGERNGDCADAIRGRSYRGGK